MTGVRVRLLAALAALVAAVVAWTLVILLLAGRLSF
jgi:hypothetical protein